MAIVIKGLGPDSSEVLMGFGKGDDEKKPIEWKNVIIKGLDVMTGKYVHIQGQIAET